MRRRLLPLLCAFLLVPLAAGTTSAHAAKSSCGTRVIADWYDNSRIDGHYSVRCLRQALGLLHDDQRNYSGIADDINAALLAALHPAAKPHQSGGRGAGKHSSGTGNGSGTSSGTGTPSAKSHAKAKPAHHKTSTTASDKANSDSGGGVPLPLIILGALGGLLALGGVVSVLNHRFPGRLPGLGPRPQSGR